MNETSRHEEMKRYLYREMAEDESASIETLFFTDNDYFYELLNYENDLIDAYVRGKLDKSDALRFERSLAKVPERQEKIATARALQTLIAEEKPVRAQVVAAPAFWERISDKFSLKTPLLSYAMGGLIVVFAGATGILLYQNQQKSQELARLQNEQDQRINARINVLERQIAEAQTREQNLQRQIENEQGQNNVISRQLEDERATKSRLERELKNLLEKNKSQSPDSRVAPSSELILASAILSPTLLERGKENKTQIIPVRSTVKKVQFSLKLPKESDADSYTVRLDNRQILSNLRPRQAESGTRVLIVTLDVASLGTTEHVLSAGTDDYIFRLQKK